MNTLKKIFKRNTHNGFFKALAGFGRSMNRLYENRNHNPENNGEQVVLRKLNSLSPKIIFDGGANVGDYSLLAAKNCPDAKVFSFEPVKSTFDLLVKNISEEKNIFPINFGLYSENAKKEIQIYDSHTHSSLYELKGVNYSAQKTELIELVTGDSFLQKNNINKIDFLKLDVEGAELDALRGFENSLKEKKVRAIQFEYGYINITSKNLLADYYDFFERHNYQIGKIYPKRVEFREYHFRQEDFIGPNFIAIHKSDDELKKILSSR